MALTGLEIYKQLPKKNCGECGPPTCLAFAMSLASGKATLDSCPYVSAAARETLDSASAPPIRLIKIGTGDQEVELGDEHVMFRHDKTFYHPTAFAFLVDDNATDLPEQIRAINGLEFNRVGLNYTVEAIAVNCVSGDAAVFKTAVETVAANSPLALVLISEDPAVIAEALPVVKDRKPLINAATTGNYEQMVALAKANEAALVVKAEGLNALAELVEKVVGLGFKEILLDPGYRNTSQVLAGLTEIRRLAIKKKFRPFGYPVITFTTETGALDEVVQAGVYLSKYASMVVIQTHQKEHILPLLSWRQNLYTDPQKPITVEAKIHAVGEVNDQTPVYITTNFSLSYYSVEGEVEASKIPGYIIPVDTEGTSVLTAWAAGKFEPEKIAAVLETSGIKDLVGHREVIIPGYVAVISGKLEDKSGWKVIVGPREASGIPAFAKSRFA
ncbi:MAG: acetyl-CoA decarbonylase/synthase complex subunit gamma [Heliobacteriaceae bacterium]|nr:acetyl-CoA decarbonylase/synthase complex subunit gamma [Heliobacteriaceae bacterium]MDD4586829.1 acetyl-CoA decarbonylase/synthase complex subunit gamma [Heliobacteriaceae bacterium]